MKAVLAVIFTAFLLAACGEEENWEAAEGMEAAEEEQFILDYMETWEESLEIQNFALLENYYVINTHGYHAERRNHQELLGNRTVEKLDEVHALYTEVNEEGDERMKLEAAFLRDRGGEQTIIEETRYYYLSEANNQLKIDAIGKEEAS